MIHTYRCPDGHEETRIVSYAKRDEQDCECGKRMTRLPHFDSVQFSFPRRLHTSASDILPQDDAESAEWKEVSGTRWL